MLALAGGAVAPTSAGATRKDFFPKVISLPNGFQPEGISTGRGTSFYVGSVANGAIYRGSVRTGAGAILVPGRTGRVAGGTEVDRRNRLFVAGGPTGVGRVYDAGSGAERKSYRFTAGTSFVNDVVVTRDAAYFTDSSNPVLYVVPIGHRGRLGHARTLPLTGALQDAPGFNANGIEASPDGRTLLVVQSNTGLLFAVSAKTGFTRKVDLGGASLLNGDGLLRRGRTLYVVRNMNNEYCGDPARPVVSVRHGDPHHHRPEFPGADHGGPLRAVPVRGQRAIRHTADPADDLHGRPGDGPLTEGSRAAAGSRRVCQFAPAAGVANSKLRREPTGRREPAGGGRRTRRWGAANPPVGGGEPAVGAANSGSCECP